MPTITLTEDEVEFLKSALTCVERAYAAYPPVAQREAMLAELRLKLAPLLAVEAVERPWTYFKSTNLKRGRFTPATAELEIDFVNGASWTYIGVPADIAARLMIAESPGGFFHAEIKRKYTGAGSGSTVSRPTPPLREALQASLEEPEDAERATNPRDEEDSRP